MQSKYAVAGHWPGGFDEAGLQQWSEMLRKQLDAPKVSLGLVFISPALFAHAAQILEILRVHAQVPLLAGCSSTGLIHGVNELEDGSGLVLSIFSLPGAKLKAIHLKQAEIEEANGPEFWHHETGLRPEEVNGWLAFADPFQMDSDTWLKQWNEAFPAIPVLGGLASGDPNEQRTQVYLNGDVFEEGAVVISIGGDITLAGVISQGCTPIGETWTITKSDRNLIHEIGNRPAYEVLAETFSQLTPDEQKNSRGNLFIGMVVNEYLEEFHRGDFLIRNLVGADPKSGVVAVGALPRIGQTIQFQRRDATAATQDLEALLDRARNQLEGKTVYGGCLCVCNGRGYRLFEAPNHDAQMIQERLGPLGLAGFFCNGEIGPVGDRNFLHGYTASLALFVRKES